MAVSYDNSFDNSNVQRVYTYDSTTNTFSSNLKTSSAFDYFPDSAVVGDCFYLLANDVKAFKDVRLYVGTAFAATSVTFTWEYSTGDGTWAALSNVTNSDAFTKTGQQDVTWDIPRDWAQTRKHSASVNMPRTGGWIRARITAVDTPTEGGAQSTQTVQTGKNWITITGNETFASIRSEDVSNGWGITDTANSGNDKTIQIYASITIDSGATLTGTNKMLEINNAFIQNDGTLTLGSYDSTYDFAYDGCYIYLKSFGFGGGHNHLGGNGTYNIYGSSIIVCWPGRVGLGSGSGEVKDSVFEDFYRNFELSNKTVKRLRVRPGYNGSIGNTYSANTIDGLFTNGGFLLLQQGTEEVTATNVMADYIHCWSVYVARSIYLINPTLVNAKPLRVQFFAMGGGDHDVYYYTQFNFDLKVIDSNGNAINGATVTIEDKDGTEVFSGTTDANGEITQQTLTQKIDFFDDPNPASGNTTKDTPDSTTTKTPHTVTITKTGYKTKKIIYTMNQARTEVEVLENRREV